MKIRKNNKGVAMVTVMIAITFIGILASSIIYMSYMNYIAKSMRYSSTDNFYTAEYGLAELSTSLQNMAANGASVSAALGSYKTEDITDIDGNKFKILTKSPAGVDCYDCRALKALLTESSQEAEINIYTTYDTDGDYIWPEKKNYDLGSNYIVFLGVRVQSVTERGFVSTVTTDIKITFDSSKADLDVNDFSVITDSAMVLDNKDVIMGGNIFIGCSGSSTDTALTLKNVSICTLLSPRGIIAGNILVDKGCTLVMTGAITVYGKITVENGGSFICTGDLKCSGGIVTKNGGIVKGVPEDLAASTVPGTGIDGDGDGVEDNKLASALITDVYLKCDQNHDWRKFTLEDFQKTQNETDPRGDYFAKADNGVTYHVQTGLPHPANGFTDSLILNATKDAELRGDSPNSTVVSVTPITFYGEHKTVYMRMMTDEAYEFTKSILIGPNQSIYPDNGCKGHNIKFAEMIQYPSDPSGNWYRQVLGKDITFPVSGALDKELTKPNLELGTPGRKVYYKNNCNYLPAGYFIVENSSQIISDAFSATQGNADPKNSYVSYANWEKE